MSTIHTSEPRHNCPQLRGVYCKIDGKRCTVLKSWQSCPKIIRLRYSEGPEAEEEEEDPRKWEI